MPEFILALDQGTTSSRSIVFDHAGRAVAVAQREFAQHFPHSGWVEHDAEEIWATQAATITEVLARARLGPGDIAAIGSGGNYALAAARALSDYEQDAEVIARRAMAVAAEVCVFTNDRLTVETIEG